MKFTLLKTDSQSNARVGEIETFHGKIPTPFMPIKTQGTVKAVDQYFIEGSIPSIYHLRQYLPFVFTFQALLF